MKKFEVLLKVSSIITLITGILLALLAFLSTVLAITKLFDESVDYLDASLDYLIFLRLSIELVASVFCIVGGAKGLKKKRNTYVIAIIITILAPIAWILELFASFSLRNILAVFEVVATVVFFLVCSLLYKRALDKGLDKKDNVPSESNQELNHN